MKLPLINIKNLKAITLASALVFSVFYLPVFAAKGSTKEKKGVVLRFDGFQSKYSLQYYNQLRLGSIYRGSLSTLTPGLPNSSVNSIITYQRGNTTVIIPYHRKPLPNRFKLPEKLNY